MSGSSNPSDYSIHVQKQNKTKQKRCIKTSRIKKRKKRLKKINRASGTSWTVTKYPVLLTLAFQKEGRKKMELKKYLKK